MRLRIVAVAVLALIVAAVGTGWAGVPGFMREQMGTLKGQIFVDGKPFPDAIVSFFDKKGGPPPIVGKVRRVPDMVGRTDANGYFSVQLMPGEYSVGTLKRAVADGPGPPREGEKFFFVRGGDGKLRYVSVPTKQELDAGRLDGVPPGQFEEFTQSITIRGTVKDPEGKPVEGMMVSVKDDINSSRPKYISEPTGKDGRYEMKVPPGRYFVVARGAIQGGRPRAGSSVGIYGKGAPMGSASPANAGGGRDGQNPPGIAAQGGGEGEAKAVEGKDGAVLDKIDIVLHEIPDPDETRKKFEAEALRGNPVAPAPPFPVEPPAPPK